jgi:hypothetical protein
VDASPEGAPGPEVHVAVESWRLEAAPAPGVRIEQQGRTAALVAESVGTKLEPDLAVESKVGILL